MQRTGPSPSSASVSATRRVSSQRTPVPRGGISATARNSKDATTNPKPVKESGNGYDDKLVEMINTTIVDRSPSVKWDDVGECHLLCFLLLLVLPFSKQHVVNTLVAAGLDGAKQALLEMVILPAKRRDLFTGLRRPARGKNLQASLVSS